MPEFEFVAPTTAEEAVRALAAGGGKARPLAGGTDLLVQLKAGRAKPSAIVDLKRIPGMIGIREAGGGFTIGAATPGALLGEHAALAAAWPGVVEGSQPHRIDADSGPRDAGRQPVQRLAGRRQRAGDDRRRRDLRHRRAGKGRREIPVEQVATGPGQTSLAADEFVLEIKLPARPARSADAYLRSIPRTEMDIAVVGAGVCLTLDAGGKITAARVALGAVAPTALLVPEAAAAIVGTTLDEAALDALDAAARAAARPIADKRGTVDYRIKIAGVLARRAARIAYGRAEARA